MVDSTNPTFATVPTALSQPRWQWAFLLLLATLPHLAGFAGYYWIDDGHYLNLASQVGWGEMHKAFGLHFNGHFRPLPLFSFAVLYSWFGAQSPLPYHLFSLLLHVANVLLAWRLLRRLLGSGRELLAWAGACLFAVHWYASEAVGYISALGVLWCLLGGLIGSHGIELWKARRQPWALALVLGGVILAMAGGEYCVAVLPFLVVVLLFPRDDQQAFWPRLWQHAPLLAGLIAMYGSYVLMEVCFANRGRLGSNYKFGWHAPGQLRDSIAQLIFPSSLIGMDACFGMAFAGLLLGLMFSPALRRLILADRTLFLLLGGTAALVPFAPSLEGNYGRFLYIAAPLLCTWVLHFLTSAWQIAARPVAWRPYQFQVVFGILMLANLFCLEKRIVTDNRYAEVVHQVVAQVEDNVQNRPDCKVKLQIIHPSHHLESICLALHLIRPAQILHGHAERSPADHELWLVIDGRRPDVQSRYTWRGGQASFPILPTRSTVPSLER